MDVVSPTSVAAPCKLELTALARIGCTGEIFSFLEMASPTGASISTVATLSTKADTSPANSASAMMSHFTLGSTATSRSDRRFGILDRMNRSTVPMVPASIISTFQSTVPATSPNGTIRRSRNSAAADRADTARYLGSKSSRA